jgi:hypothetical protein
VFAPPCVALVGLLFGLRRKRELDSRASSRPITSLRLMSWAVCSCAPVELTFIEGVLWTKPISFGESP